MMSLASACACDADIVRRLVKAEPASMLPAFLITSDPLQKVLRKRATARDGKQYSISEFQSFYGEYLFVAMWREALERDCFGSCDLEGRSSLTLVTVFEDEEPPPSETGAIKDFPTTHVVEKRKKLFLRLPKRLNTIRDKRNEVRARLMIKSVLDSLNLETSLRRALNVKPL